VITEFVSKSPSLLLKYVCDHNVRALGDEAARVAGTHSTGTAGDDHRPMIEAFHGPCCLLLLDFGRLEVGHDQSQLQRVCQMRSALKVT
jgi:hypothetical protein